MTAEPLVSEVERMATEAANLLPDAEELSRNPQKRPDADYLLQLLSFEILLKALMRMHNARPDRRSCQ